MVIYIRVFFYKHENKILALLGNAKKKKFKLVAITTSHASLFPIAEMYYKFEKAGIII